MRKSDAMAGANQIQIERGLCRKVPKRPPPRQVDIGKPTSPSKAELNEDVRVNATFEEAVDALTRPVEINYVPRPPRRG